MSETNAPSPREVELKQEASALVDQLAGSEKLLLVVYDDDSVNSRAISNGFKLESQALNTEERPVITTVGNPNDAANLYEFVREAEKKAGEEPHDIAYITRSLEETHQDETFSRRITKVAESKGLEKPHFIHLPLLSGQRIEAVRKQVSQKKAEGNR